MFTVPLGLLIERGFMVYAVWVIEPERGRPRPWLIGVNLN